MKMKLAGLIASTTLAIAPLAPASAHGFGGRHHGGSDFGLFALGAVAIAGTAAILTAPFNAIGEAASGPAYYQQPQPVAMAPQPYYAPPAPVYYAQAPVYYQQPPVYYAPRPVYYRY